MGGPASPLKPPYVDNKQQLTGDAPGHRWPWLPNICYCWGLWQPFQTKSPKNAMLIRWFEEKHNVKMIIWTFFWSTEKNGIALICLLLLDPRVGVLTFIPSALVAFLQEICPCWSHRWAVSRFQRCAKGVGDGMARCVEKSAAKRWELTRREEYQQDWHRGLFRSVKKNYIATCLHECSWDKSHPLVFMLYILLMFALCTF